MSDEAMENLAGALARVQAKLPEVEKQHTGDAGSYKYEYADLADVSEKILPLLGEAGLSWICRPTMNERGDFVLAYKLLHVSGEFEAGEYPLLKPGSSQQMGSAITYARRYALCAVTGVAPKGDDNDAADQPKTSAAQRRARPAAKQQEAEPAPPRSAQRARVDGPPLPGDDGPKLVTGPQRGKFLALFDEYGVTERDERLDITRRIIGRDIASANELTAAEASKLIDRLGQAEQHTDGFSGFLAELMAATEVPSES